MTQLASRNVLLRPSPFSTIAARTALCRSCQDVSPPGLLSTTGQLMDFWPIASSSDLLRTANRQ